MNIHNIIFPKDAANKQVDMYLRGEFISLVDRLVFFKGKCFSTNTFYNSFSLSKWIEFCSFSSLFFYLKGEGEVKVSLIYSVLGSEDLVIASKNCILPGEVELDLSHVCDFNKGLVYVLFEPLTDGVLTDAGYFTKDEPINHIKLGLVITHFNRQEAIQKSTKRLAEELLSDDYYRENITLTVIDNSQNSGVEEQDNLKVINNLNLGGSGGFSRGLLELDTDGTYTHCLFMDDDASCETEAIRRTFHMLQYAKDPKLAISGALLREDKKNILWEKGAIFDGMCRPEYFGLDMTKPENLLIAEQKDKENIYGAWWFFAFNIKGLKAYPIPFFVRGDDVSFSLTNDFKTITVNGIASYGEDFGLKSGAMPLYLDVRSHLVEQLYMLQHTKKQLFKTIVRFFASAIFSYNYGTARSIIQAVDDFMEGPSFFVDNKDMKSRFGLIKEFAKNEMLNDEPFDSSELQFNNLEESKVRYVIRVATLNGYLIPKCFYSRRTVFQPKGFRANLREVFLHREVRYVNVAEQKSYVAKISKRKAFVLCFELAKKLFKLNRNLSSIKSDYETNMPRIMTKDFWQDIYKK
ncbi:glycosyltransferase family 2 protein [Vibrio algivorus]|uniref:Glycosyltransferase n=1 Tax=Vibrio algivorus TaxID=1667024 RepID=A0A557P5M8_9VIBR|nr:glycosyltransferase [Vibrio algivorus]TVO35966.1 glycosyltransferase [Vibrio algivorus]